MNLRNIPIAAGLAAVIIFLATIAYVFQWQTTTSPPIVVDPAHSTTSAHQTFEWISASVASDFLFHYYQKGATIYVSIEGTSTALPSPDPADLIVAKDSTGSLSPYSKDHLHVYYTDPSDTRSGVIVYILPEANPTTFRVLFEGRPHLFPMYAEDNNHVFISAYIIPYADPTTFTVLEAPPIWYTAWYAKDANHVFYGSEMISGADPATFVSFSAWRQTATCNYDAEDKNHIYLHGRALQCSVKGV
jgi:hypothetical protein